MTLDLLLAKLGTCQEGRDWAKGRTLAEAWASCERGHWMLWLAHRMLGEPGWPTEAQLKCAIMVYVVGYRAVHENEEAMRNFAAALRATLRALPVIEDQP